MPVPKILVIPGSLRARSYNVRLAALAAKELTLADADVTRISLLDYPLPIYDGDLVEKSGAPHNAVKLKQLMSAHQGVFIASPEYNASITPLIKNTIDWISVVRERGELPLAAYQNRVFALGGASPRSAGAISPCWRCARCWPSAAVRWCWRSRSPCRTPSRPSTRWTACGTRAPPLSSSSWCASSSIPLGCSPAASCWYEGVLP